jgi:hypothetical protein
MSQQRKVTAKDSIALVIFVIICYVVVLYAMVYFAVPLIVIVPIIASIIPVMIEVVRKRRVIVVWYKVEVDEPRIKYFWKKKYTRGELWIAFVAGLIVAIAYTSSNRVPQNAFGILFVGSAAVLFFLLRKPDKDE